ncbi:HNH endonuclease [Thiocystis violacea]|uniref:HNH endonuclease n=1 Tax=Thiocystis violacea TaxID=13725 RepID=UPI001906F786|nr:HNH endonuclease [Thiocystis violacea]MBK1719101.1 hypothetical protein [Thiocystis violacea]
MRLTVDFSKLHAAVKAMGADTIVPPPLPTQSANPIDPIDIALSEEGIEVDLKEITIKSGLLDYHGRQILLYIQDHGSNIQAALDDPDKGRKYHVADCRTLKRMREEGRFQRYVATNDLSGYFLISGYDYITRKKIQGRTKLKICRDCLTHLNYQGYRVNNKNMIFSKFSIEEFFETYSSFFPYMPRRKAGDNDSIYTDDWPVISGQYKADQEFKCESCDVDLTHHKRLLHTHHKNGVKTDNRRSNFQALCVDCHRKQPSHERMFVRHEDMQLLTRLRQEQQQDKRRLNWDDIFEIADTGVHGVLHWCRAKQMSPPIVGYALKDSSGQVIAQLELAWPLRKICVAISTHDLETARKSGWQAWSILDALEQL